MARRELGPASLAVAQAVAEVLPPGPVILGCSGGADSLALALGARWAARRCDTTLHCVVIDHGLQTRSVEVAKGVVTLLTAQGLSVETRRVYIASDTSGGPEAAARDARLDVLASFGSPVLLGHTLDDQAESVLLGLLRGSGTRSLAGMARVRGPFLRPLLNLRRGTTVAACREWGVVAWQDPHNSDDRFRRVRARNHLKDLSDALGQDVAPALARSAALARMDADLLDQLAADATSEIDLREDLLVEEVAGLPDALRFRVVRDWMAAHGSRQLSMSHVQAVDSLISSWRGQGPVDVPGGRVQRRGAVLHRLGPQ